MSRQRQGSTRDMHHGMEHSFTLTRGLKKLEFSPKTALKYLPGSPVFPLCRSVSKRGIKPSLSTDLMADLCGNTDDKISTKGEQRPDFFYMRVHRLKLKRVREAGWMAGAP